MATPFAGGRWAYFAFTINWYAPNAEDPKIKIVEKFFGALNRTLGSVPHRLTGEANSDHEADGGRA